MKSAYLLIDAKGAEIQHRSGLTAPDAFIYLAQETFEPVVFFDAREFKVMKNKLKALQSSVQIEPLEPYLEKIVPGSKDPLVAAAIEILKERNIEQVLISGQLPYASGQLLETAGITVAIHDFAQERELKTVTEIEHIKDAQKVNESAFELAWQILADSTVKKNKIMYDGKVLTSEILKSHLKKYLLDHGYYCPDGIIVASGEQTAQPHNEGSGPLLPNECIIIDIFPRSEQTGYFADMTRTFVKGKPSKKIKELFRDVETVQHYVADKIQVGQKCLTVHQETIKEFAKLGHETSIKKGFMHGTGHSLGLNLHEDPSFNSRSTRTIESGMVFTVEPGLYYPGIGGVRIEDVIVFHPDGRKENITNFHKSSFIPA